MACLTSALAYTVFYQAPVEEAVAVVAATTKEREAPLWMK
jgi:hypothetical protein